MGLSSKEPYFTSSQEVLLKRDTTFSFRFLGNVSILTLGWSIYTVKLIGQSKQNLNIYEMQKPTKNLSNILLKNLRVNDR